MERLYMYMVVKLSNEPESEGRAEVWGPSSRVYERQTHIDARDAGKSYAFDAAQRSRSRAPGGFEMSSAGGCEGIAEEDEDENSDKDEENEGEQQKIHEEYRD